MLMRYSRVLAAVFSLCALTSTSVLAQTPTGQISGRVTDASGAVLPGVDVTFTQTDTGLVRSVVTNEGGQYVVPSLPIGPYRLEVALQGFRTFVQSNIVLQVNANLVVDASLSIGELNETITVTSRPSDIAVETRSMGVGAVRSEERRVGKEWRVGWGRHSQ